MKKETMLKLEQVHVMSRWLGGRRAGNIYLDAEVQMEMEMEEGTGPGAPKVRLSEWMPYQGSPAKD